MVNREGQRRRMVEKHRLIDQLKSVPCAECGHSFAPYVMDFDHRDPSSKEHEINTLLYTSSPWSRIADEIAKCDVVCVRCHRLRTWHEPKHLGTKERLIQSLKAIHCKDCDRFSHYSQMDFDHVRGEKVCCVPHAGSKEAILAEAAKCDVVCANCHRERTHNQAKGAVRNDPHTIDMAWKRRSKNPQSMIVPEVRSAQPAKRHWHDLVGQMPDVEVARISNIVPATVHFYRKKLGIPVFRTSEVANG